jgi:hypothetical protein
MKYVYGKLKIVFSRSDWGFFLQFGPSTNKVDQHILNKTFVKEALSSNNSYKNTDTFTLIGSTCNVM